MKKINSKGFTLIELLVVIAIIGVLATMSTVAVNIARNKAKIAKAQNDIDEIYKAIATLANDTNSWPGHQEIGLCESGCPAKIICDVAPCAASLSDPSSGIVADDTFGGWNGPYMNKVPIDPWNHEYFFDTKYRVKTTDNTPCNGDEPLCRDVVVVGSYGPDGVANGLVDPYYGADDVIKLVK